MSVQKKLEAWIPEESPLSWMIDCFGRLNKRFLQRNWKAALVLSCMVLNQTCKLYLESFPPWPMNFCIALTARQGTGKGLVKNALQWMVRDTHLTIHGAGSPEGIIEQIYERRYGFLIWDEAGEAVSKGAEHLARNKFLLNAIHDLDKLGKNVVSRAAHTVEQFSYYISPLLICLPEQWQQIEKNFQGGFERRFLEVRLNKFKGAVETGTLDEEFVELAGKISAFIDSFDGVSLLRRRMFSKEEEEELSERIGKIFGETNESKAGEYFYKLTTSIELNAYLSDLIERQCLGQVGQVGQVVRSHQSKNFLTLPDHTLTSTDLHLTLTSNSDERASFSEVRLHPDFVVDLLRELIKEEWQPADETLANILSRIEKLKDESPIMSRKQFSRIVVGDATSEKYNAILKMLSDLEIVKVVKHPRRDWIWVILDREYPTCPNCKFWKDGLCTCFYTEQDRRMLGWRLRWYDDGECDKFELDRGAEEELEE